jgi:biopolymer transport protein ExbB
VNIRPRTALPLLILLLAPIAALAQDEPATPEPAEASVGAGSFLGWMAEASGPIGIVLLLMSIYMVAVIAWMFFEYRRSKAVPEGLVRDLSDLLNQRRYPQAFDRLSADPSPLARVLNSGVRRLNQGQAAAQRAMQLANDDVTMEMEHRTTYLATIGTLGPLIGLLGTVYGMIIAFRVMSSQGTPDATGLAGGISIALFATLEGVFVAIPAISFYAFFRNRIARISMDIEVAADALLELFSPGVRAPNPLSAGIPVVPRPAGPPAPYHPPTLPGGPDLLGDAGPAPE